MMRCVLAVGMALCGVAAADNLVLEDARVRAMPPGQTNTVAYVKVTNVGATAVKLVGASSDIAQRGEFHQTVQSEGMMRMVALTSVPLAAGESLQLRSGGRHIMLYGLRRQLLPGERVALCLITAAQGTTCTTALVAAAGESAPRHHH